MNNNIIDEKKELRRRQLIVRKNLFSNISKVFDIKLFENLFQNISFENVEVVSSFNSINTEINTNDLNNYILSKNKILCFPAIIKKDDYLIFRKFTNHNDMYEGSMRIKEPQVTNEVLLPNLLFVPCLAYDSFGFRLGYGGGYYDRTLSYYKSIKQKFITVGYAFDDQKVHEVPKDKFDIKLDYVITEKKIYSFL